MKLTDKQIKQPKIIMQRIATADDRQIVPQSHDIWE